MDKTNKVITLSSIILVGFAFGVFYHYFLGNYLNLSAPFDSFLYPATEAFCDFAGAFPFIKDFAPYESVTLWVVYFPLTYLFIFPFVFIKPLLLSYSIFVTGFLTYLIFMNIKCFYCKNLTKIQNFQNIFILSIISYPILYLLDKGNFDMLLFVFLGLFVFSFKSEKYLLSAFLLALENAMKPFCILFLFLFLFKKKYKEFLLSVILTVLFIFGGFLLFHGGFFNQIIIFIKTMAFFKYIYVYLNNNDYGMGYASSLFMPLKLIFCKLTATPIISPILLSKVYDGFCFVITAITIFFVWREKSFWKQLTLLICNFLLLPYITYDYKLIFLFIPIWLFVNDKNKSNFDLFYTVLFALLFVPKNIVISMPHSLSASMTPWFSLSIIINPVIMIVLSLLIIYEQFHKKEGTQKKEAL